MQVSQKTKNQLILALDGMNREEVFVLLAKIPDLLWVKVGLELFINSGPEILLELRDLGLKIFLDLKFHDIPVTMSAACRRAAKSGVELLTVHACAGSKALYMAKQGAEIGSAEVGLAPPTLLAVTILTSWDEISFGQELLINQPVAARVNYLTTLAAESGIDGVICSPLEVKLLRSNFPKPFELVTPGIRNADSDLNDQSRVMTPSEAIKAGASRLVIGRPITRAADPARAFQIFSSELESIDID